MTDNPHDMDSWRARMEERVKALATRVSAVEQHPTTCSQIAVIADHERRMRIIERALYIGLGGLAVLNSIGIYKIFHITVGVGK
jgi:hypothetical protein